MPKPTKKHPVYCQPINLPISLGRSIPDFLNKNNIPFDPSELCHVRLWREYFPDEFINFFHNHNVQIRYAELFILPPGGHLGIHSDSLIANTNVTKLNIVEGDETAVMAWYTPIDSSADFPIIEYGYKESTHRFLDENNAKLEFLTPITQPSLVNVGAFHNVYNLTNNKKTRYCVSMLLSHLKSNGDDELLEFQDAVTIFKDYLNE